MFTPQYDGRATAVASSSWRMLQAIGVGDALEGKGCPIEAIRVSEGLHEGGILFDPPPDDDPLGMMFENRLLRATPALHERDFDSDGFEWIDASDAAASVIAFERRAADDRAAVVAVELPQTTVTFVNTFADAAQAPAEQPELPATGSRALALLIAALAALALGGTLVRGGRRLGGGTTG